MPDKEQLQKLQKMALWEKVITTKMRVREWISNYGVDNVYVSFSGGKDSTVLLDIVRQEFPKVKAVFVNTGLEYPEIQQFVKAFDNVDIIRPKMNFLDVIKKYGYPIISKEVSECVDQARKALVSDKYNYRLLKILGTAKDKDGNKSLYNIEQWKPLLDVDFKISNQCCNIMKKGPTHKYSKINDVYPMTAQMASESRLREQQWLKNGCNGFDMKRPISNPMSFWTENDVLQYIKENNLKIASVYGEVVCNDDYGYEYKNSLIDNCKYCTTGCQRTGCIFCGFGLHLEKGETRFQRLKRTHSKQYSYCLNGGEYNENGMWQPNKQGLGMKHIFDELNKIYGKNFIRYE